MSSPPLPRPFTVARDRAVAQSPLHGAVVAIGNFDGVHRGHRVLLDTAIRRARARGRPAAALTFEPHPRSFFQPDAPSFRLSSEANKLRLLKSAGLDGAIVLTFDAGLAGLSAPAFIDDVLRGWIGASGVVAGFNFHFGAKRQGSPDLLRSEGARQGFSVEIVEPQLLDGVRVSSGAIREALTAGDIANANSLLGYPWFVTSEVVHGEKRGRELGFPTANLRLEPDCGLRAGIYAVRVSVGGRLHDAVASFGRRPMFDNGALLLEVFLFDFTGDLYGQVLDVAFVGWIRPEMTFDSVDDLVRRMEEDSRIARNLLARHPDAFPALEKPAA